MSRSSTARAHTHNTHTPPSLPPPRAPLTRLALPHCHPSPRSEADESRPTAAAVHTCRKRRLVLARRPARSGEAPHEADTGSPARSDRHGPRCTRGAAHQPTPERPPFAVNPKPSAVNPKPSARGRDLDRLEGVLARQRRRRGGGLASEGVGPFPREPALEEGAELLALRWAAARHARRACAHARERGREDAPISVGLWLRRGAQRVSGEGAELRAFSALGGGAAVAALTLRGGALDI